MKKNVITFIIMVAMLTATFLTGCDTTESNTIETTAPTVVATEETTSPTEGETEDETVVPTEKATESNKKKSDEDAEDNEDENENEDSGSASNTSNNSSSGGGSSTTNKKPSSNNNSGSSSTNNKPNNNSGSNSSNNKPSNNSSSNNNKPNTNNNNNSNSGNTNTKPAPTPVITDDTDIPHSQLCTDANMQKVTSAVNDYFINLGMIYNPSLNANNCGWFYDCTSRRISECSVNYFKSNVISGFESEANAFLNMYDSTYSDLTFYCYAERRSDGEYDIYFCHE